MGCKFIRDQSIMIEIDIFQNIEYSFGIHTLDSKYLDRAFYRHATKGKLTRQQFSACCNYLSINFAAHSDFFANFIIDYRYSARMLSCFGILIGTGKKEDKAKILFQNYDLDCSKTLDFDEIDQMIKDLINIACFYIPEYVNKSYPKDDYLKSYWRKIKISSRSSQENIVELILDGKTEIIEDRFIERFMLKKELKNLLTGHKLRRMAYLGFKGVIRNLVYVDYFLEKNGIDGMLDKRNFRHKRSMSS